MRKLFLSFHGLGDNILLTPVLRKYKGLNPDVFVGLTHLRRLPVPELLRECPYVDEWLGISDAWNDYESFEIGYKAIVEEAKKYASVLKYDEIIPITMSPQLGIVHKIHRAAHELGITVEEYRTEIFPAVTNKEKEMADEFLSVVEKPYIFLHLQTGNAPKNISGSTVEKFLSGVSPMQVIEYGSKIIPAHHLPIGNIPLEMEILSRCSKVVCADSFIMHAAGALGIPTTAVFLLTPPEWVIPLHETPIEVYVKV